jgi:membrane protein
MRGAGSRTGIPTQRDGGPGPDSPLDLQASDWKSTARRTLKEIKDDRVTFAAAGMAYYFFLAVFPALIALVGILGLVHVDASGLVESIRASLPGGAGDALTQAIRHSDRPSETASLIAAIIGVVAALWSASSGFVALQSGLNIAYDVDQDRRFVGKRGVALILILATGLLGGVPSPFFTFGESTIFTVVGWILTIAAIIVLFSLFYYLGPNRPKPSWHWVSAGGVLGALIWIVGSVAFGVYINNFNNYDKTYGPLGGVIVLVLWLFLSSVAVLIGGELNAELERQAARKQGFRAPDSDQT